MGFFGKLLGAQRALPCSIYRLITFVCVVLMPGHLSLPFKLFRREATTFISARAQLSQRVAMIGRFLIFVSAADIAGLQSQRDCASTGRSSEIRPYVCNKFAVQSEQCLSAAAVVWEIAPAALLPPASTSNSVYQAQ